MKYCWYESKSTVVRKIEPYMDVFLLFILLYGMKEDIQRMHIIPVLVISGFCFLFIGYMMLNWFVNERKYCLTERGISVKYPFGIQRHYVWSDFRDITVCKVRFVPKDRHSYSVAIRCATETEYPGPRSAVVANEKWATEFYDTIHWKMLITIEYTDERYKEFHAICPQTIHDYRHLENPK